MSHVGHAWVTHAIVFCLHVRYGGRRQQGMPLHRLRASHVIASGVDVRCTVTDAVFDALSLLFLFRRWNACNCLIVRVLLYNVVACTLGLALTDCLTVFSRPVIF